MADKEHSTWREALEKEHAQKLGALTHEHESVLDALRLEHESELQHAQTQHSDALDALKKEHASHVASLGLENEEAIKALAATHAQELNDRLRSLEHQHAERLASMRAAHEEAIQSAHSEQAKQREALHDAEMRLHLLTSKVAEAQNALAEMRNEAAEHRAAAEEARAKLIDQSVLHPDTTGATTSSAPDGDDTLRAAEHASQLQASQDRAEHYMALASELRKQLSLKEAEMNAALRAKEREHEAPLAELADIQAERAHLLHQVVELSAQLREARAAAAMTRAPSLSSVAGAAPALSWAGSQATMSRSPSTVTSLYASPEGSRGHGSSVGDDHGEADVPAWVGGQASMPVSLPGHMNNIDPEVADAIIQCMRGEWLYKYAPQRRLLGAERRHKRYFFINPFNRTIHWTSEEPKASAGHVARSKNAFIEQVALMDDYNSNPSGLYYQTIVIRSGHREVKVTAPSKVRHRIWCTALGYLLQSSDSPVMGVSAASSDGTRVSIPVELGGRGPTTSRCKTLLHRTQSLRNTANTRLRALGSASTLASTSSSAAPAAEHHGPSSPLSTRISTQAASSSPYAATAQPTRESTAPSSSRLSLVTRSMHLPRSPFSSSSATASSVHPVVNEHPHPAAGMQQRIPSAWRSTRRSNPDKRVLSGPGAAPPVHAAGIMESQAAEVIHNLPPPVQAPPAIVSTSTPSKQSTRKSRWW